MKSDAYLRGVLTVIAACLVWMCFRDAGAVRASSPLDVKVVDVSSTVEMPVLTRYGKVAVEGSVTCNDR